MREDIVQGMLSLCNSALQNSIPECFDWLARSAHAALLAMCTILGQLAV